MVLYENTRAGDTALSSSTLEGTCGLDKDKTVVLFPIHGFPGSPVATKGTTPNTCGSLIFLSGTRQTRRVGNHKPLRSQAKRGAQLSLATAELSEDLHKRKQTKSLGVASPFFPTNLLFKNQPLSLDPWKEWGRYPWKKGTRAIC